MSRRSRLGVLAVLALVAVPASAHAAEWTALPEIAHSSTMTGTAAIAPGGSAAIASYDAGMATARHRPARGASFGPPASFASWTVPRIAALDDGTTLAIYRTTSGGSVKATERSGDGPFDGTPQDLGAATMAEPEVVALPDGSALVAFVDDTSAAIRVFRRAPGTAGLTPLQTIPAPGVGNVVLRGGKDGTAVLAYATEVFPPGGGSSERLEIHVATLAPGDGAFDVELAHDEPHTSPPGSPTNATLGVSDVVVGDDGSIEVAALRRVDEPTTGTTATTALAVRGNAASGWDAPDALDDATSSLFSTTGETLGDVRLVAGLGGAVTAFWTRHTSFGVSGSVESAHRAPAAAVPTSAAAPLLAGTGIHSLSAVGLAGGTSLLRVTHGPVVKILELSGAGAVTDGYEMGSAPGGSVGSWDVLRESGGSVLSVVMEDRGGTFHIRPFVLDRAGAQTPAPPVVGGSAQQTADTSAPAITGLKLSRKRFATRGKKRGTQLRFSVSEAARVAVAVERSVRGWKAGKRCTTSKPKRKAAKKAKRCTVVQVLGSFTRATKQGANKLAFTGKLGKKTLKRGTYRFRVIATDAAGNRSKPARATFTIKRP